MMRQHLRLFRLVAPRALLATLSAPVLAAEPQTVRLFNGKDLAGWSHFLVDPKVRMEDVWSVRDGVLVCKGEPLGFLYTDAEHTSFKLVVEWRWAEGAAARLGKTPNSGVLLRVNGEPKAIPRAYEAQLQSGYAGDLYGFWGMPLEGDPARRRESKGNAMLGDMVGFTKAEAAEKPEGEWNVYEIVGGRPFDRRPRQREEGERGEGRRRPRRAGSASSRRAARSTSGGSSSRRSAGSRRRHRGQPRRALTPLRSSTAASARCCR